MWPCGRTAQYLDGSTIREIARVSRLPLNTMTSTASLGLILLGLVAWSPFCNGNSQHYKFRVGDFEAVVLSDGTTPWNVSTLFPNLPLETVKQALADKFLPTDFLPSYFNILYVDTGDKKFLVECGNGDNFGVETGRLLESMKEAGLDPNDIDAVLVSHMHVDHIGGVVKPDGSLSFPNAKYYVSRLEYEFWKDATIDDFPSRLDSLKELLLRTSQDFLNVAGGKLITFELGDEVIPGVRSLKATGHTPGHSAFVITSGNDSLVQAGDAFVWELFNIERPTWRMQTDADHMGAIETRFSLLEELSSSRVQHLSYHNNFPGLGHVVKDNRGFTSLPFWYQFN